MKAITFLAILKELLFAFESNCCENALLAICKRKFLIYLLGEM